MDFQSPGRRAQRQKTKMRRSARLRADLKLTQAGGTKIAREPPVTGVPVVGLAAPRQGKLSTRKDDGDCARRYSNIGKVRKIVKLLAVDQSLKVCRLGGKPLPLPKTVPCGSLRKAVRSMYAPGLNPIQELSIKTSAKAEAQPCGSCADLARRTHMESYQKARLTPVGVSDDHLSLFSRAFARNVPAGWNKRKEPYVPNGHATLECTRREGGNWVDSAFSNDCRVELVWSSGKPRVVTLYSEHNVRVLTPLHHSLYSFLKGKGWLLVGSPTESRLLHLRDGCVGSEWLSFDYESATDNIKTDYVRIAVEELINKGDGLCADEVRCLRVLSQLRLDGALVATGQPMGSPMSFPLLCLINKTVVDMSLTDLLIEGKISFKEWTSHRCLINGDDLLTRSTSCGDLYNAITKNGAEVGLRVNQSKTMVSTRWAEINSTAFYEEEDLEKPSGCSIRLGRKTNVSALWMGAEVRDVLGFARESTVTAKGFGSVVLAGVTRLARQKIKTVQPLPPPLLGSLLRNPRVRRALTSGPGSSVPDARNLLVTEPVPDGFSVTREEVMEVVTGEVTRLKRQQAWRPLFEEVRVLGRRRKAVAVVEEGPADRKSALARLQPIYQKREKRTLSCLARFWRTKQKETLLAGEESTLALYQPDCVYFDGESCSPFTQIMHSINEWKDKGNARSPPDGPLASDPFHRGDDFIGFPDCLLSDDDGYDGEVRYCE